MATRLSFAAVALLACTSAAPNPPSFAAQPVASRLEVEPGVSLWYQAVGTGGDTVIVVHGGPGSHSGYFLPDLQPLSRGRTLIFYDQRGGGRSTLVGDSARLTAADHVRDLEAVRRHFGLDRLTLVGHSWGGALVGLYAAEHPERVRRILLVSAMPLRMEAYAAEQAERQRARPLDTARVRQLRALAASGRDTLDPVGACRERVALVADSTTPHARGSFCDASPEALRNGPRVAAATMRSLAGRDRRQGLDRVTAPALVIHGADDAIPPSSAREWAETLGNARLLLIPHARHAPYAEAPDAFFPAADRFLRGEWPAGSEGRGQ